MTTQSSITENIQRKVTCFTNEKYIGLFETILRNEINYNTTFIKEEGCTNLINNNSLVKKINDDESKRIIKNKDIWRTISRHIFTNDDTYDFVPSIIIQYLKLKVKNAMPKLLSISTKYNHPIDFVLEKYLDICRYEIRKMKARKKNIQKYHMKKKNLCLMKMKSLNNKKAQKLPLTERGPLQINRKINIANDNDNKNNEEQFDFEKEEDEEENHLNLFIGNFNIKSFKEHNQSVYMKKYDNISTFIFVDKEDPNNPNAKNDAQTRTIVSRNGGKKHTVTMPKIYDNRGSINIHRFETFGFLGDGITHHHPKESRNYKTKNVTDTVSSKNNYTISFSQNERGNKNSKKLTIKIDKLPNNCINTSNNDSTNRNYSKQYCHTEGFSNKDYNNNVKRNLFMKKGDGSNNLYYNYNRKIPSRLSIANNNFGKQQEKTITLSSNYNKTTKSNKITKSKNKIKITNFFSRSDLYY